MNDFQAITRVYEVVKVVNRTWTKGFARLRAGDKVFFVVRLNGSDTTRGRKFAPCIDMYDAISNTYITTTTFNMLGRMFDENIQFREVQ